ncbi:MAG: MDR family MFS transporter [Dermatophilaceae bacterium]
MAASTSDARVPRSAVGLRSERGPVLLSVMLSIGLVALDATILAAAVPALVRDLGGFDQFPWLFSAYVLAQAVSIPLYGKLADLMGRKRVMLVGVAVFVVGSLLCGVAWSMGSLVAFRAIQGLGAGAVQPVGMTIVGDIYSVAERATVQGYLAAVWAVSSVLGPALGGLFADYLSWRGVFLVNLPLGAVAAWMLWRRFDESRPARPDQRPRFDVLGTALLVVGTVALLVALLEGGVLWSWTSAPSIGLGALAAVCLVLFGVVEARSAEPVLPLWVFRHRVVGTATLLSFVVGVLLLALTTYIPLFAQGVLGASALAGGFALATLLVGWPIAATTGGWLYLRFGFRMTMTLGAVVAVAGGLLLLPVDASSPVAYLAVPCLVMGLGFGWVASPAVVAAQGSVEWARRGVATGATVFARSLGSAVGVAAFGAVVNAAVRDRLGTQPSDLDSLPPDILDPALQLVFAGAAVVAVALVAGALLMPRHVTEVVD